jgi:hypothetical protein
MQLVGGEDSGVRKGQPEEKGRAYTLRRKRQSVVVNCEVLRGERGGGGLREPDRQKEKKE